MPSTYMNTLTQTNLIRQLWNDQLIWWRHWRKLQLDVEITHRRNWRIYVALATIIRDEWRYRISEPYVHKLRICLTAVLSQRPTERVDNFFQFISSMNKPYWLISSNAFNIFEANRAYCTTRFTRCGALWCSSTLAFGSMGHGFGSECRLFSHHDASAFSKLRSLT